MFIKTVEMLAIISI